MDSLVKSWCPWILCGGVDGFLCPMVAFGVGRDGLKVRDGKRGVGGAHKRCKKQDKRI